MSSKVRFTILNKAGKVIRSTNRPLLNNNTVKYKKKIYKLLEVPSSMRAKYVIIVDSESSTSVDYNKKIKLMSLEEFKNISHTEKQKSTGWTKVIYPGGSMVTDIKYGAKKDVYETLKLKGILPKTYKHKSKIHVKEDLGTKSSYKPEPNIGISPYKDLVPIMEGVYKGQNVSKSVQKDAEKLFDAIYGNDLNTVIKIGNKYENEYSKSKKRGTTRGRFIPVDSSKVRIFNLSTLAESKMK